MRMARWILPAVAALVIAGLVLIVVVRKPGQGKKVGPYDDLLALKQQAERLTVEGKLADAHAKYQELFLATQGRKINDPMVYLAVVEDARIDQNQVYVVLLRKQMPGFGADLVPPPLVRPGSRATAPTTTNAATAPAVGGLAEARVPAPPATAPHSAPGRVATTTTAPAATTTTTAVAPAPAPTAQPRGFRVVRTPRDPDGFSDAAIGAALAKANAFLIAQFKDAQTWQGKEGGETYRQGLNALVVYALMSSGQATRDPDLQVTSPRVREMLDRMKQHAMVGEREHPQSPAVYARSLRAVALAMYDRPEDHAALKDDAQWLTAAHVDGAYSYDDRVVPRVIPADRRGLPRKAGEPIEPPKPTPKPGFRSEGPLRDELGRPIELADGGFHMDARTGLEIVPRIVLPPPPPSVFARPQYLPDASTALIPFVWDNSNSQYGAWAVSAAAEVGIEVPEAYWAAVQKHWLAWQRPDGRWFFNLTKTDPTLPMTLGGVASLTLTRPWLESTALPKAGQPPTPAVAAVDRALAWLEAADHAVDVAADGKHVVFLGYNLHALSRAGLTTGLKHFGVHDWYRELARKVVLSQNANGSWGKSEQPTAETLIDTAYTVLFLARGRPPLLMNKLRLDTPAPPDKGAGARIDRGPWNNRPRDLANLAAFASRELERPLNWGVASIDRDPAEWADAPILYFATHQLAALNKPEILKLKAFTDAGGLLLTHADDGADNINVAYRQQIPPQLWPGLEYRAVPDDDEIYTCHYKIAAGKRPRLWGVHNGARWVWIHSPTDIAGAWQQRAVKTRREAFELGVNLYVYAAGKSEPRNRVDARTIPAPTAAVPLTTTVPLQRVRYAGAWDPEPAAFARFARHLRWETGVALDVQPVDAAKLEPPAAPGAIAHLSGTAAWTPADAELTALRAFVSAGGTLIVEAVGPASAPFADSLQATILPGAFPGAKFDALPPDHPVLRGALAGTEGVWPTRLRPYAAVRLGPDAPKNPPPIRVATVGKGRVVYLPLDTTSGLLGTNTWSIFGYESTTAQALMKNLILWYAQPAER
ncbi:MAG: DUF4159 domain-containing protein [Phycisphaerae bacterium]